MKPAFLKVRAGLILAVLSFLFLPLGAFRPNRVVSGIPLTAQALMEGRLWLSLTGVILIVLTLSRLYIHRMPSWTRPLRPLIFLAPWLLAAVPGILLVQLSQLHPAGVDFDPVVARISLSAGFWLLLTGILLLQSSAPRGSLLLVMTVIVTIATVAAGLTPQLALYKEFLNIQGTFFVELKRHLVLALASVAVAALPGILLGYACHRRSRLREWILGAVNLFQVAPTLSLLGLIMIPLTILSKNVPAAAALGIRGIGFAPAFIVLTLYCLLPITANAYAGFDQVEASVVDSAAAMGMTHKQIFGKVLFPLAFPVIFSGIRTAVTQNVGNTILAGLIGGGGMGALIFLGLSQSAPDLVILGTLPVVLMALSLEVVFKLAEARIIDRMGVTYDSAEAGL